MYFILDGTILVYPYSENDIRIDTINYIRQSQLH